MKHLRQYIRKMLLNESENISSFTMDMRKYFDESSFTLSDSRNTYAPLKGRKHFPDECSVLLYLQGEADDRSDVYIHSIETKGGGACFQKGYASAVFKQICDTASRHNLTLSLEIQPMGDVPYEVLERFYKNFGFEYISKTSHNTDMIRKP